MRGATEPTGLHLILAALDEQTVAVPGAAAADTVLPRLAESLKTVLAQRKTLAGEVEEILDAHPLARVARILLEIGDASAFKTSGQLAAYAGIAPVTHRCGRSIRGEHPARTGNRNLKRDFFPSQESSTAATASISTS